MGCPNILAPSPSQTIINNATCPYDLTALLPAAPIGIQYEYHSANNTNANTIVSSPNSVITGNYFVFGKDANGCYSSGIQISVNCASNTCSAPQGGTAIKNAFGVLVAFSNPLYPPASNSYTVKRRLANTLDLNANYTTLSTPVFNAGTGKWEVLDNGTVNNTLYVYKIIANCPSGEQFIFVNFSSITCPVVNYSPTSSAIPYTFTHVGGQVDKYVFEIFDSTGTILININTHILPFGGTINAQFSSLSPNSAYIIKKHVYIGTTIESCSEETVNTTVFNNWTITKANSGSQFANVKVNGSAIYNGNVVNGTPVNGYSALIPTLGATIQLETVAAIASATLNGAAPSSQPASNIAIWNNITSSNLNVTFNT
jgi:hypothetical protein